MKFEEYTQLPIDQQRHFMLDAYEVREQSIPIIAESLSTYSNKIRREFKKLGIVTRTRDKAQSLAIRAGRSAHPTKGKNLTDEIKEKISNGLSDAWSKLGDDERRRRAGLSKAQWDKKSDDEKELFFKAAGRAVREASIHGSKLERSIHKFLIDAGYRVEFHKEEALMNVKLQLDLYLPEMGVAIEVDGPSHTKPIWGQNALDKSKQSEYTKNGQVATLGLKLIRVRSAGNVTKAFANEVNAKLIETLELIKQDKITDNIIYIGE